MIGNGVNINSLNLIKTLSNWCTDLTYKKDETTCIKYQIIGINFVSFQIVVHFTGKREKNSLKLSRTNRIMFMEGINKVNIASDAFTNEAEVL